MNTPESIAENFTKLYSANGEGDDYPIALFSGLTLGVVVDTDDPLQAGRLRIFCPALNDNPKKPQHLPWSNYISPFSGVVNNNKFYRGAEEINATSEGSLHYGFWAIPDMGAHVLVGCIDGDPRRRFWIGCMPEHQQNNTLFHGRYKWKDGKVEGPLTGNGQPMQPLHSHMQRAFDGENGSPEFRSRVAEYQPAAIREDVGQIPNSTMRDSLDQQNEQIVDNDPDTWEHATLGAQGYDWSGFKALGGYMASRVFGMSSPGMHAFTMDDRPFNSRIRLRTTAGHQILMDDTNERIYIATYDGNSYVEMDVNGNVDVFSANRISFHAEKDINFNTDKTFRVFAREGIHLYSGSEFITQDSFDYEDNTTGILRQSPLGHKPQDGEIRIHATADLHMKSEQNIRQLSLNDTFMESNGNFWGKVDKSYYLQVQTDINITTNVGDYNLTVKNNVNETVTGHSKRFTYGNSAVASNGRNEVFSFESTLDMGALNDVNVKSSNSGVMLEAQGNGGGGGNVKVRSPSSQFEIGDDGISAMTEKSVRVKSEENAEFEVRPGGPKLSSPVAIEGIPNIDPTACNAPTTPIPWNGSRTTITLDEAAKVAYNAGFRGQDLPIAVAVMMGESSLRTTVTNPQAPTGEKWGDVVGLFQIRTLKHPDSYTGVDRLRDNRNRQLEDPNWNAKVGYEIFSQASPPGKWTVGKWESFGGKHAGKLITNNLPAATAAVNRLCGQPLPSLMDLTPESFSLGYEVDGEIIPSSEEFDFAPMSFGPVGNSTTPSSGTSLQLSKTVAKLQSMADIEFKSLTSGFQTSYNNLVTQVDTAIVTLDQLSFSMGTMIPIIKQGFASVSNPFNFNVPFSFDLGTLSGGLFDNMMPPQLQQIAGSMAELNQLAIDLGGLPGVTLPITLYSIVGDLQGNAAALSLLGLPTDLNFPINPGIIGNVDILQKLSSPLDLLDIPVIELPNFQELVDRIFANNSIPLHLDI